MDTQTLVNIIVILSLTPIFLMVVISFLFTKIKDLKSKISELENELSKKSEEQKEFVKFYIGSKVLVNDFSLSHTDPSGKKTSFTVDYEAEVIDISETEVKLNAISFIGNDSFSRDPQNKIGINQFMQNRWISKELVQLILDESHNRQVKLNKLGI